MTDSDELAAKLRLLRNHGLKSRDEVEILGYNSRLDTLQAIVGNWLIRQVDGITEKRIANAERYDRGLLSIPDHITLPPRRQGIRRVYHLYMVRARRRDQLYRYLQEKGVEAKVHYPIPLHLQRGLAPLGYKKGDFPETEAQADSVVTFPADQHLKEADIDYVLDVVHRFYKNS